MATSPQPFFNHLYLGIQAFDGLLLLIVFLPQQQVAVPRLEVALLHITGHGGAYMISRGRTVFANRAVRLGSLGKACEYGIVSSVQSKAVQSKAVP